MKILFTLLIALITINAFADDIKSFTYTYTDDEGEEQEILLYYIINDDGTTASITNSSNDMFGTYNGKYLNYEEIIVPEEITDGGNSSYTVTVIADYAFGSCYSATIVKIPDSVVEIGNYSINMCYALESVTLSENLASIGTWAFRYDHSLKEITIPKNVTYIGDQAFYTDCRSLDASFGYPQDPSSLSTVTVEAINPPELGSNVFVEYADDESEETKKPTLTVPNGCYYLYAENEDWASYFDEISDSPITYDNGEYYFYYIDQETQELALKLTGIAEGATSLTIPTSIEVDGVEYEVKSIASDAFSNYTNLAVTLEFAEPTAITIADGAFPEGFKGTLTVPSGSEWKFYDSDWVNYFTIENTEGFTTDGFTYTINNYGGTEVTLTNYKGTETSIEISNTLTYEGIDFTVTNISSDAFSDYTDLSVTVEFTDPTAIKIAEDAFPEGFKGTLIVQSGSEADYYNSDWFSYFIIYGYNAEGDEFTIDGITYQKTEDEEAEIIGVTENEIEIVTSVTYNTEKFTTISITPDSFANSSDLSVTVNFTEPNAIKLEKYEGDRFGTLTVPEDSEWAFYNSTWSGYFTIENTETFTTDDGFTYTINNYGGTDVTLTSYSGEETSIEISNTLTYADIEFTVTNIDNGVFTDHNFTELTLNWALEEIPEDIDPKELFGELSTKLILHVPSGSEADYYNSDWFSYFIIYGYNAKDDKFTIDGITYQKTADNKAQIIGVTKDEIEIGTTVTYNMEEFTVTNIAKDAFTGYTELAAQVNFIDPETIELGQIATTKVGYLTVPDGAVGLYEDSDWNDYFYFYEENRYLEIDSVYFVFKATSTQTASLKASHSAISLEVDHVDESATNVTIPSSVSINLGDDIEVTYDVTSMSSSAFKDCENLTTVTIEANIPAEDADALTYVPEGCTVIVSDDKVDSYQEMFDLAGVSVTVKATSDAITIIKINEKIEIARYNLLGQKISSPQRGINIIKYSDGTAKKVLIK